MKLEKKIKKKIAKYRNNISTLCKNIFIANDPSEPEVALNNETLSQINSLNLFHIIPHFIKKSEQKDGLQKAIEKFYEICTQLKFNQINSTTIIRVANNLNKNRGLTNYVSEQIKKNETHRAHEIAALLCDLPIHKINQHIKRAIQIKPRGYRLCTRLMNELEIFSFKEITNSDTAPLVNDKPQKDSSKKTAVLFEKGCDLKLISGVVPNASNVTIIADESDIGHEDNKEYLKQEFGKCQIKGYKDENIDCYSGEATEAFEISERISKDVVEEIGKVLQGLDCYEFYKKLKNTFSLRLEDRLYPHVRHSLRVKELVTKYDYDRYFLITGSEGYFFEIAEYLKSKNKEVFITCSSKSVPFRLSFFQRIKQHYEFPYSKISKLFERKYKASAVTNEDINAYIYRKNRTRPKLKKNSILIIGSLHSSNYGYASTDLILEALEKDNVHFIFTNVPIKFYDEYDNKVSSLYKNRFYKKKFSHHLQTYYTAPLDLFNNGYLWSRNIFAALVPILAKKDYFTEEYNFYKHQVSSVIESFIIRELPSFFDLYQYGKELLDSGMIKFIITTPGREPQSRSLLHLARERNIFSMDVQAIFHSKHPRYKLSIADIMCVIDSDAYNLYKTHFNTKDENLYLAGSIVIDRSLKKIHTHDTSAIKNALGIQHGKTVITLGTQPWKYEIFEKIFDLILEEYFDNADIHLVVKLHPNDSAIFEDNIAKKIKEAVGSKLTITINQDMDIFKVINASDALITIFSNIGLEAALSGIPVVSANIGNDVLPISLGDKNVALECKNIKEFKKALKQLSTSQGRQSIMSIQENYGRSNPQMYTKDTAKRIIELGLGKINGFNIKR